MVRVVVNCLKIARNFTESHSVVCIYQVIPMSVSQNIYFTYMRSGLFPNILTLMVKEVEWREILTNITICSELSWTILISRISASTVPMRRVKKRNEFLCHIFFGEVMPEKWRVIWVICWTQSNEEIRPGSVKGMRVFFYVSCRNVVDSNQTALILNSTRFTGSVYQLKNNVLVGGGSSAY